MDIIPQDRSKNPISTGTLETQLLMQAEQLAYQLSNILVQYNGDFHSLNVGVTSFFEEIQLARFKQDSEFVLENTSKLFSDLLDCKATLFIYLKDVSKENVLNDIEFIRDLLTQKRICGTCKVSANYIENNNGSVYVQAIIKFTTNLGVPIGRYH